MSVNPVVCILHYGNVERTRRLYESLSGGESDGAARVRVLDNASPEPWTGEGLWTRLDTNRYWAGALAWALDALGTEGFSHCWFCNNDIDPLTAPPYLTRLRARLEKLEKSGRVGIISPAFSANPYHPQMKAVPGGSCARVAYVDGIAPLVSLECVREIGGVDYGDNPYGYGVDIWLALRASRAGWGVYVDHNVLFRHQYHSEAAKKEGFLETAARAEERYMRERLGPDWREELKQLQSAYSE